MTFALDPSVKRDIDALARKLEPVVTTMRERYVHQSKRWRDTDEGTEVWFWIEELDALQQDLHRKRSGIPLGLPQ
jgi:hypothetical protein